MEKQTMVSISRHVGIWASAQDGLILSHPAGPLSLLASKWLFGFTRLHLLFGARGPAQTMPAWGARGVRRAGRVQQSGSRSGCRGDKGVKT